MVSDLLSLLFYAVLSLSVFQGDVEKSLKADVGGWPEDLLVAEPRDLDRYRASLEEKVGNLVNEKQMVCEEWRPWVWCGGRTRSGYTKFWFFSGCALGAGHPPCQEFDRRVEQEAEMLRGVERKISSTAGYASPMFLKSLFKTYQGAVNATLGLEDPSFYMHLLHSDVAPTAPSPVHALFAYLSFLNFPPIFLYQLSMALPWLLFDFAPLDKTVDAFLQDAAFLQWGLMLAVALPYYLSPPSRHGVITALHLCIAHQSALALGVLLVCYALYKLDES